VEGVAAGRKARGTRQLTVQDSASKKLGRRVHAQAGRSLMGPGTDLKLFGI
jgi:hypothetical protein